MALKNNAMIPDEALNGECFAFFQEKASNLLFVLSGNGEIIEANHYAASVAGENPAGKNIRDVLVDFSGSYDFDRLLRESSKEHLFSVHNSQGLPQSFYFTFKQIPGYVLAFGRLDAEELETMRKEILALNQELNNLTRELHKKNVELKKLNEEKNRFLGMAAHDLRKPIGLVITYSDFLIEEVENTLDSEQFGFLKTINASSTFMKRLVDDFLDVSAIEAGRFDMDLQPALLDDVIDKSLELNHVQANKKNIELRIHCPEVIPAFQLDAGKIEQVITNLVSNAIEHSNEGSRVIVSLEISPDAATVTVQDFGSGIPPEEMDKLFKPFGKTSTKKTGGEKSTGLGLLITRKIIEAHGGRIWVESQTGKGTTIYFQLPAIQEAE
jgi:signal transduction histidine kinase